MQKQVLKQRYNEQMLEGSSQGNSMNSEVNLNDEAPILCFDEIERALCSGETEGNQQTTVPTGANDVVSNNSIQTNGEAATGDEDERCII